MSSRPTWSCPKVRRWMAFAAVAAAGLWTRELGAQGLPSFAPINPMATSRSGLYFQPYRDAHPGWTLGLDLDYASTIEYNQRGAAEYILDSEQLRLALKGRHDLGRKSFVLVDIGVRGAYNGFLDGFLDWYHRVLGITLRERQLRPRNEFLYHIVPNGMAPIDRHLGTLFLDDVRVGAGWRYSPVVQGVVSVTLPTATGPSGYGRGTVSANLLHTLRAPVSKRVTYEGSLGVGYTPTYGSLAPFQRQVFAEVSSGFRARLWQRQGLYANLLYHTPYYRGTGFAALDRYDMALDFGWLIAACRGPEWRFGMTEDPKPSGPGVDLIVRLGVAFRTRTAPCAGAKSPSPPSPGR